MAAKNGMNIAAARVYSMPCVIRLVAVLEEPSLGDSMVGHHGKNTEINHTKSEVQTLAHD